MWENNAKRQTRRLQKAKDIKFIIMSDKKAADLHSGEGETREF